VSQFILGAITALSWAASVFFWYFWRRSRDPLFLAFAFAFLLTGANRAIVAAVLPGPAHDHPAFYVVRLLTYLVILAAIVHKNRSRDGR